MLTQLATAAALLCALIGAPDVRVAASSGAAPLYQRWLGEYPAGGVRLVIAPQPRAELRSGRAEIAATGLPEAGESALPVAVSAVAVAYNLLIAGDLRLDAAAIEGILCGRITRWRDPALLRLNPGVVFPDQAIHVITPADAEPEAVTMREYLSHALRRAPAPFTGRRTGSTLAVAQAIGVTEGAIGFVDAPVARRGGLFLAAVANRAGSFTVPSARSVSRAAVGVRLPDDLRASIVDAEGADAYPIAALVYAAYQPASNETRAFLRWAIHDGQRSVTPLGYAQLPGLLTLLVDARLRPSR